MQLRNRITSIGVAVAAVMLLSACGSHGGEQAVSCETDPYQPGCRDSCETNPFQEGCSGTGVNVMVGRTISGQLSLECYTIYPAGEVDLRHGGLPDVNDSGYLSNGEIEWTSGRVSSVYTDGTTYTIDGLRGTVIPSCVRV